MAGNRRWYQFRLGTLMIVVTILATFLGYHVNWIRQRHKFLIEVDRSGILFQVGSGFSQFSPAKSPGLLWLFGERGHAQIMVSINDAAMEGLNADSRMLLQTAKRLFPEADVSTIYVPPQGNVQIAPAGKFGY